MEYWKDIKGYEGYYQISNDGQVKNVKTGRILKQYINGKGYKSLTLSKNNKIEMKLVHRLVAEAFIPNPNNLPCVNHKDCDPSNNCVENLEFCTYEYNNTYADRLEKARVKLLNREEVSIPVIQYTLNGVYVDWYPSEREASRRTKTERRDIKRACNGERFTAGGYIWRYKD